MIAFINGNMVEGSLEEIAKLLGINLDDSSHVTTVTNTDSIPAPSCPPVFNPQWQSGQRELELDNKQSCPPDYNPGFCYPNANCDACWTQWQIDQRVSRLNKLELRENDV